VSINSNVNVVVGWAVESFNNPGPLNANAEMCIQLMISKFSMENDGATFSEEELVEINDRFIRETTHPPLISDDELEDNTHTDSLIDGSWYGNIVDFTKWEAICDNWNHGHPSSRLPNNAITNINKYTNHIFSHSNNPDEPEYIWKGLVVGNVQSGKTATYTGLIGKAIDVGYRVILVMSGRMNSLRFQTEARITHQVVGSNNEKSIDIDDAIWNLTSLEMKGDFGQPYDNSLTSAAMVQYLRSNPELCLIGVVKKHHSPLGRFRQYVQEIIDDYPDFQDYPFLLIDDEMDEAGPNTGGEGVDLNDDDDYDPEESEDEPMGNEFENNEPSTTNQMITKLLKDDYFKRRMYLGFTATPYAVLAHTRREEGSDEFVEYGPDIFPDNYLLVLDDPVSYCGGDVFLGRTEVIVRDMWFDDNGALAKGDELLRLPAFNGVEGIVQIIPSTESCDECAGEVDDQDRRTHGPRSRHKSHCSRRHFHPLGRIGACLCNCHQNDEYHRIVPPYNELLPSDEEQEDDPFSYAEITPSIMGAIDDYILAGAARAQRGDGEKPCTMLINASHRWIVHFDVRLKIQDYVESLCSELGTPGLDISHLERLEGRWNASFSPLVEAFNGDGEEGPEAVTLDGGGNSSEEPIRELAAPSQSERARPTRPTNFDAISGHILPFIRQINHRVLNSHSDDVVDYDLEPNLKAIVHGGWNLGRGLTFKGLVTVYMLRGHGDMSGLMQMQRWCGYRGEDGGERILDLMRIYLTEEDRDIFHRMLSIEKKNRYLLSKYVESNRSPGEFKSVLEEDPDKPLMSVSKRGAITKVGNLLSGRSKTQIAYDFNRDEDEKLLNNRTTLSDFLDRIETYIVNGITLPGYIYRDVPTEDINWLINNWEIASSNELKWDSQQWIERLCEWNRNHPEGEPQLTHWTIFIPSRNSEIPMTNVRGGHAQGFDPLEPIILNNGTEVYPYPYPLDSATSSTGDKLKMPFTNSAPGYTYQELDSQLFFGCNRRPVSHGLMIISPVIHPFNRNHPRGSHGNINPSPVVADDQMHAAGDWPHLLSIGMWFPTTSVLTTEFIQHGGASGD